MQQLLSLKNFFMFSNRYSWMMLFFSLCILIFGIIGGFILAPADYIQGEGFRIIYVHVPAAFLSLGVYTILFLSASVYLIWRIKLADIIAQESAAIGAFFTFIALVTGSLWGKPMWGTWWVWDARLTSECILFFIYLGYSGLRNAISDLKSKAKISAVFAIVGMADIPIVHFSVSWWNTLHQGPTLARFAKPAISPSMLIPLLIMIAAFALFYIALLMMKVNTAIIEREKDSEWMKQWMQNAC